MPIIRGQNGPPSSSIKSAHLAPDDQHHALVMKRRKGCASGESTQHEEYGSRLVVEMVTKRYDCWKQATPGWSRQRLQVRRIHEQKVLVLHRDCLRPGPLTRPCHLCLCCYANYSLLIGGLLKKLIPLFLLMRTLTCMPRII